jgi:uridylate kinase
MKKQKIILISLGGAIICPEPGRADSVFLKKFREMIMNFVKKGYRFVIVTGGGRTSREYLESQR